MAIIRPFRGLRPVKDKVEKVASPPYDVINSDEARELAKGNPHSFLHVVKPEIDLDPSISPYDDRVYAKAVENLGKLIDDGALVQDPKPRLYFYRLTMEGRTQTGLVCCCACDDYDDNVILKHENTRKDKEKDRSRHVSELDANAGPVFFTYKAQKAIDALADEIVAGSPEYDFTSFDGIRNEFWVVEDENAIDQLVSEFAALPNLYVADGHHRTASGSIVRKWRKEANPNHTGAEEYNYFLAVLFPDDQLHIMDYNRVVKDLNGLDENGFLEAISDKFDYEVYDGDSPYKPEAKHYFGMYLGGKWYKLMAKQGTYDDSNPVERLDVAIMQNNLLSPILGIGDPRTDKRIDFVGGIRGLGELENRCEKGGYAVAFALHPTSIEELMSIADAGE
ncbi:MAG: DUF1015 domain-containing protein, partial [bacterium]|nr:DUF1015 domain-containing protein [bacterium]